MAVTDHLDMLMSDRLRNWAQAIEMYGADIGQWGDRLFVIQRMRDIAQGIEDAIKDAPPSVPTIEDDV